MSREVERRYLTHEIEWRVDANAASPGHLVGYASKFDKRSQDLGGFVEVVDRGAFTKSVSDNVRVLCRFNHKDDGLLGTTDAGTLTISVDNIGLRYDVTLPNTSVGRDVAVLAERGDLRNSSFAFECMDESWGVTERGFPERRVLAARLVDVAPVVNPAYLDATVGLRSLANHLGITFELVQSKSTEEIRSMLTGEAVPGVPNEATIVPAVPVSSTLAAALGSNDDGDGDVDGENVDDSKEVAADGNVAENSLTENVEQRDTHSIPASLLFRMSDFETKHGGAALERTL